MSTRETIFALASGPPPAALALVRVSGPSCRALAAKLLRNGCPAPRRAVVDKVLAQDGRILDEALVIFMPGPNSFTGEDVLEVSLHGGAVIVERVLDTLSAHGARLAEPGEFTRRAFEAGKLDLTRAEAIADLIDAESDAQHAQALKQYGGALADLYEGWRRQLTDCLALLEASIDFPDEDDAPERVEEPVRLSIDELVAGFDTALESGNLTERIRDGFRVAILGPPNAGKSTLLNRIAGRDAAIVTDIPGTTRDVVEVRVPLGGYLVWFMDTAGLRDTDDVVEAEGVRRARRAAAEADVRIWVFDSQAPVMPGPDVQHGDILVANKADLGPPDAVSRETLVISAHTGDGVSALLAKVRDLIGGQAKAAPAPMLTRARHRQGIEAARTDLRRARDHLDQGLGAEFVAEDVRQAARALASLTGAVETEAVLGAVFSSFCIGK